MPTDLSAIYDRTVDEVVQLQAENTDLRNQNKRLQAQMREVWDEGFLAGEAFGANVSAFKPPINPYPPSEKGTPV